MIEDYKLEYGVRFTGLDERERNGREREREISFPIGR